jgi:predicted NUDIX family NTP pyrophosphohydrolase
VRSAGLLVYRRPAQGLEVLLGHMGGPFWSRRHERSWSIPKGELGPDEGAADAAGREFTEETGAPPPPGRRLDLGEVRQPSGKLLSIWAVEGDLDPSTLMSNHFSIQWPRGSGRLQEFAELDRFGWFDVDAAVEALTKGQVPFVARLVDLLDPRRTTR